MKKNTNSYASEKTPIIPHRPGICFHLPLNISAQLAFGWPSGLLKNGKEINGVKESIKHFNQECVLDQVCLYTLFFFVSCDR